MNGFSVMGSHVVVVGAARSGMAAATLLAKRGARVTVSDSRVDAVKPSHLCEFRDAGVSVELGEHRAETFGAADLIVLSPGVSPKLPVIVRSQKYGVPVISEIELAARWLRGRIVAITGTKGKSTTTLLTSQILDAGGYRAIAGGNIGTALCNQVEESTPDAIHVVETSSFQLEATNIFRPWIAVFLNLSPDHLDRHESFEEYAKVKARIFENQTHEDAMVINADDPRVVEIARAGRAKVHRFSVTHLLEEGVQLDSGSIAYRSNELEETLVPLSAVQLPGLHNLSNVAAAAAVGRLVGVASNAMTCAVQKFSGLEHALEYVAERNGIRFINDSKATNVVSSRAAIECFDQNLVVILGGRFKGGLLEDLGEPLRLRDATVVALGEAQDEIREALSGSVAVIGVDTMAAAVSLGQNLLPSGGTVLLSPACASLDMFRDYAERGQAFKEEVMKLADR